MPSMVSASHHDAYHYDFNSKCRWLDFIYSSEALFGPKRLKSIIIISFPALLQLVSMYF